MKIALIANACAGGRRGKKLIPLVETILNQKGIAYDLYLTRFHKHAVKIANEIPVSRYDALVSLGGDGTNYEVKTVSLNSAIPDIQAGVCSCHRDHKSMMDVLR